MCQGGAQCTAGNVPPTSLPQKATTIDSAEKNYTPPQKKYAHEKKSVLKITHPLLLHNYQNLNILKM